MNWLDGISIAYVAYGAARGRKRGLPEEAYRCVRLFCGLLAGCGLLGVMRGAIEAVVAVAPEVSAPVSFLATFGGAFALLRVARRTIMEAVKARFASVTAAAGAVAGAVRAAIVILSLVTAAQLSSSTPHEGPAAESFVGRVVGVFTSARPAPAQGESGK